MQWGRVADAVHLRSSRIMQLGRVAERHTYSASILELSDAPADFLYSQLYSRKRIPRSGSNGELSGGAAGFEYRS
jgi:hypothetical protein